MDSITYHSICTGSELKLLTKESAGDNTRELLMVIFADSCSEMADVVYCLQIETLFHLCERRYQDMGVRHGGKQHCPSCNEVDLGDVCASDILYIEV